jgi:PAS domain S-box-containing protein
MPQRLAYQVFHRLADHGKWAFGILLGLKAVSILLLACSLYAGKVAARERSQAYEAMVSLERLAATMGNAERGQRGYLLTDGREDYLAPYLRATTLYEQQLALVKRYRPFPRERVTRLEQLCKAKFAELDATVSLYRAGRGPAARGLVATDRGKALMDRIEDVVHVMQVDEQARVDGSSARLNLATTLSFAGFMATTTLTAVTLVGLIVAYGREEQARKAAEFDTERALARYTAITRAAPVAVITIDQLSRVSNWNPAAERTFGWTAEEIVGRPLGTLIPPRHRADCEGGVAAAIRTGTAAHPGRVWEFWGLRRDGREFPAEVTVDLLKVDGEVHCIGIVRDITPRRHMEARQAALRDDLQRSNDELLQFAYVASHDLQEPLRMVSKYVALLEEKYRKALDERADRYIRYAVEGSQRMRILIEDLLLYSRVTTKARPPVSFAVAEVLDEVLRDLETRIEKEGGQVIVAPDLPVVRADRSQFRQVLQNLLANALKFHREGVPPVVRLSWGDDGDSWRFSVEDNGIGIPASDISRLFLLFTRLHGRDTYEGTGIGLAICKKIVERHGGRIWIESEPEMGSTFHFTMPKEYGGIDAGQPPADPAG